MQAVPVSSSPTAQQQRVIVGLQQENVALQSLQHGFQGALLSRFLLAFRTHSHATALQRQQHVVDGDSAAVAVLRKCDRIRDGRLQEGHQHLPHLLVHAARDAFDACRRKHCLKLRCSFFVNMCQQVRSHQTQRAG